MASNSGSPLARKRILIVDDDLPSARLIQAALADTGCTIESAATGAGALALLLPTPPHVVLLDLALPDMSGLELARAIKSSADCRDTLVVAVTSRNGRETERAVLAAGCDAYLRKPIDALALPETLARILKR